MSQFVFAQRVVHALGATYQGSPANLIDADPATTADIYLTGSGQADWFNLDMGAETSVASVTLVSVTGTGSGDPLGVVVTDTPSVEPNNSVFTCPNPIPSGAPQTMVFTAPTGGQTGRYVQIRLALLGSVPASALIGGASYTLTPPTPVPAPTLTATPSLPGGVPSIILQGS